MAHKIGRKLGGSRNLGPLPPGQNDLLGIGSNTAMAPQPAPFQPSQPMDELGMPTPGIGGGAPSGGMNLGQPAQPQQGMPCPDPSAHTQQQAPAQNDNLSYMQPMPKMGGFMGAVGSSLGRALGQQRPSMMPNGYLGNPMPRPRPRFPFMGFF